MTKFTLFFHFGLTIHQKFQILQNLCGLLDDEKIIQVLLKLFPTSITFVMEQIDLEEVIPLIIKYHLTIILWSPWFWTNAMKIIIRWYKRNMDHEILPKMVFESG